MHRIPGSSLITAAVVTVVAAASLVFVPASAAQAPTTQRCGGKLVTVNLAAAMSPTEGADVILGTPGDDTIAALGGDDVVCGLGGRDTIDGGPGNDKLLGGPGRDVLIGGRGADTLHGNNGVDKLIGGTGNDTLVGGKSNDRLRGGPGTDTCNGGAGNDKVLGCEEGDVSPPPAPEPTPEPAPEPVCPDTFLIPASAPSNAVVNVDDQGCSSITGQVAEQFAIDRYVLDLDAGDHISMIIKGACNTSMRVVRGDGTQVLARIDCVDVQADFVAEFDSLYTLEVGFSGATTIPYVLNLWDITTPVEVPAPVISKGACADTPAQLATWSPNAEVVTNKAGCSTIAGRISVPFETDTYRVDLAAGDRLSAFADGGCDTKLTFFSPDGEVQAQAADCTKAALVATAATAGTYRLDVTFTDNRVEEYDLELWDVTNPEMVDAPKIRRRTCAAVPVQMQRWPNESKQSRASDGCAQIFGKITAPYEVDRYVMELEAGATVFVAATGTCSTLLTVADPRGNEVDANLGCTSPRLTFTAETSGAYTLDVNHTGRTTAKYTLRVYYVA